MSKTRKRLRALVLASVMAVSTLVMTVPAERVSAATAPSNVVVSVAESSVNAGGTVNVTVTYSGDTATQYLLNSTIHTHTMIIILAHMVSSTIHISTTHMEDSQTQ